MHSRERRDSEVAAILEALGKENDTEELELTQFVEDQASRLNRNVFLEFLKDISTRIREYLTNGSLLIAVRAVDQLIRVEFFTEEPAKLMELVTFLTATFDQLTILESAVRERVLNIAVDTFGRLVKCGGAVAAAKTGRHIEDMLELLDAPDVFSLSIALRLLTVLARDVPTRFNLYAERFITKAYPFLFHEQHSVRQDALDAFKECLSVIQRPTGKRQGCFVELAKDLMKVVEDAAPNATVQALVALQLVVRQSSGNLITLLPLLHQLVSGLLRHRDKAVENAAIRLIPLLAQVCPESFAADLLPTCIEQFLLHLQDRKHEMEIFSSIGDMSRVLSRLKGLATALRINEIATAIRTLLVDQNASSADRTAAVKMIGIFVHLMQDEWKEQVLEILPFLLDSPMNGVLLETTRCIVEAYPEVFPTVQSAFLQQILEVNDPPRDKLLMVLKILGTFRFDLTPEFIERVHTLVPQSLAADRELTLKTAATAACTNILTNDPFGETESDVSHFLDSLCDHLTTATMLEIDRNLRLDMLNDICMSEEIHLRLAQDINIRRLSYALYDADVSVRRLSVQLIGRLSRHNFSSAQPILHALLMKLIEDLKFNGDRATTATIITDTAMLLKTLMVAQPGVTEMHLVFIMEGVISRLELYTTSAASNKLTVKDPASAAIHSLLLCLIEVIHRLPNASVRQNISRLASILSELINDKNDRRKQTGAMRTIETICEMAGGETLLHQLKPSELLSCLTELKTTTPLYEAQTFASLITTLSRWDPAFLTLVDSSEDIADSSELRTQDDVLPFPTDDAMIGDEDYYSSVAIHASLAVLDDTRNTDYEHIVKCLMNIFGRLQRSGVVYLQRVIPVLTKIVRQADDKLRRVLFQHLSDLVRIAGRDVAPYCDVLMNLCFLFWSLSTPLTVHILNLVAELARAVPESFSNFLPELIPKLGEILSRLSNSELMQPTLQLLQACAAQLGGFLPVLFPILISFLQKMPVYEDPIPLEIQRAVLTTMKHILFSVQFKPTAKYLIASRLFLTLIELLRQEESLKSDIMDTLVISISVLGHKISRAFSHQIRSAIGDVTEGMLAEGLERLADAEFDEPNVFTEAELELLKTSTFWTVTRSYSRSDDSVQLDVVALAKAWDTTERSTREDWEEWIRSLSIELLCQSSSPALRACHELAQSHPRIARWLFTYSLLSVWSKLDTPYRLQLQDALENVLLTPAMPVEVVQPIVRLGEYLNFIDQQEVPLAPELTALDSLATKCNAYSTVLHYRGRR